MSGLTAAQRRTEVLESAMMKMDTTTKMAYRCCEQLAHRARHLDSLTSPASDASSMLSRANANLAATLVLMKEAREKFDTMADCEPSLERLHKGVETMERHRKENNSNNIMNNNNGKNNKGSSGSSVVMAKRIILTEQDVYAAGDSMEILRDTYSYFCKRRSWRSTPDTLAGLERIYTMGEDAMALLISLHLKAAGQGVRPKRNKAHTVSPNEETAEQARDRLSLALQNRDLLKSIADVEEFQPIEARPIREIRSIFDTLGSYGYSLGPAPRQKEPSGLSQLFGIPAQKVARTEKVGSGAYNQLTKAGNLKTGFIQLDAYGSARRQVAYNSMDSYYRRLKQDRKKRLEKNRESMDEADAAARDAVRCLEHAMVVIAGEKNVYRTIVHPSMAKTEDDDDMHESEESTSPFYKKACVGAYSYVAGAVVDRALDIIETVFLKEGGIGQMSGAAKDGSSAILTVQQAASAAAAGLRMLDGVRMLGPSLAKLCEMPVGDGKTEPTTSIASVLCIAIHRTTVKNTARTLENLAKAIQEDPMKGPMHRPKDASISSVSRDAVHAIRRVSPFMSAYKSVSKRRALPWDPNMGDDAGDLDAFVRFLVMRLLNSLKGKALDYTRDLRDDSQAKSNLFMLNNAFFLLEELGPNSFLPGDKLDADTYRITGSWFVDKINKMIDSEQSKYLGHWEALNTHLTAVEASDLEYLKNDTLTHDSGRLIKQRFSGFNESFEKTYQLHKNLCVIDPRLRLQLQQGVTKVFLPRYRRFYDKYTKVKFSKKRQDEYTKYGPDKIEDMLNDMFVDPE